jgi:predicted MFS family arabinose efflux permease
MEKKLKFTSYQVFIIAILAIIQFTVILDFMVLSPLSAILLKKLHITTAQFSIVVSAYAISACISGILSAGFTDKFDRKKIMLFFYVGFILGTLFCAWAPTYQYLLAARIVTGIFGGVIGSIGFAIISDLFELQVRGRVMGFVQTAFAACQVLGIPISLYLANNFGWHFPFYVIVVFSIVVGIVIAIYMQPVTSHIEANKGRNPFVHLWKTIANKNYRRAFLATTLLATGGFMLMPFGSAYATNNLGIDIRMLPWVYGITGVFSLIFGPIIGKLSDQIGKFRMFVIGSIISIIFVGIYTELGITPLWLVIVLNVFLFGGVSSRIISSSALLSAVPAPQDRGAFMSINSSVQYLSGGISAICAGLIVYQPTENSALQNYPTLGFVVMGSMIAAIFLVRMLDRMVKRNAAGQHAVVSPKPQTPESQDADEALLNNDIAPEI